MRTRYRDPTRLDDPLIMLVRCHLEDLEREIEQIRLANLARAAHAGDGARRPSLLRWVRGQLSRRSRSLPEVTPPNPPADLAGAGAE